MVAVNQLAHGLLGPVSQQLSSVPADPDVESPAAAIASPAPAATHRAEPRRRHARRPSHPAASPLATAAGTVLESSAGSVTATCDAAGAYLLYWSPSQGFWADDVIRGPAVEASVTFRGSGGALLMRITCTGSTPTARTEPVSGDDGGHDS